MRVSVSNPFSNIDPSVSDLHSYCTDHVGHLIELAQFCISAKGDPTTLVVRFIEQSRKIEHQFRLEKRIEDLENENERLLAVLTGGIERAVRALAAGDIQPALAAGGSDTAS
jgi:hypothetical protein